MVFSSVEFLFVFLPVVLLAHTVAPRRARNAVLLVASLVFYAWGTGGAVVLFALGIVANQALGFFVARHRWAIVAAVVANVGVLVVVKYGQWLTGLMTLNGRIGGGAWLDHRFVVTVGLSFFTFQVLSYHFDVRRGDAVPQRNLVDFGLFVSLFPHQVAGPILRYRLIEPALHRREVTVDGFSRGAVRFAHGLVKKVVVADTLAPLVDAVFAAPPGQLGVVAAWIGVVAFALQLYFDFSGYTDMAIGIGLMLGLPIPENFDRPYSCRSIRDFWRSWNMSLGAWFRDYLYIPLGGSRAHASRNLLIVFFLVGLWHGAAATFVLWGLYHGLLVIIERRWSPWQRPTWLGEALPRAITLGLVLVGWVLFRAADLGEAAGVYRAMVGLGDGLFGHTEAIVQAWSSKVALIGALASLVFVAPRGLRGARVLTEERSPRATVGRVATMAVLFPYAAVLVLATSFRPFLYFQF